MKNQYFIYYIHRKTLSVFLKEKYDELSIRARLDNVASVINSNDLQIPEDYSLHWDPKKGLCYNKELKVCDKDRNYIAESKTRILYYTQIIREANRFRKHYLSYFPFSDNMTLANLEQEIELFSRTSAIGPALEMYQQHYNLNITQTIKYVEFAIQSQKNNLLKSEKIILSAKPLLTDSNYQKLYQEIISKFFFTDNW